MRPNVMVFLVALCAACCPLPEERFDPPGDAFYMDVPNYGIEPQGGEVYGTGYTSCGDCGEGAPMWVICGEDWCSGEVGMMYCVTEQELRDWKREHRLGCRIDVPSCGHEFRLFGFGHDAPVEGPYSFAVECGCGQE